MNQNMHTWIATALVILTIKLLFPQHKLNAITNEFDLILFVLDWIAPIIFLSVWLYFII